MDQYGSVYRVTHTVLGKETAEPLENHYQELVMQLDGLISVTKRELADTMSSLSGNSLTFAQLKTEIEHSKNALRLHEKTLQLYCRNKAAYERSIQIIRNAVHPDASDSDTPPIADNAE
jgi:hypothetical protein